jgi:hypothetical protein
LRFILILCFVQRKIDRTLETLETGIGKDLSPTFQASASHRTVQTSVASGVVEVSAAVTLTMLRMRVENGQIGVLPMSKRMAKYEILETGSVKAL